MRYRILFGSLLVLAACGDAATSSTGQVSSQGAGQAGQAGAAGQGGSGASTQAGQGGAGAAGGGGAAAGKGGAASGQGGAGGAGAGGAQAGNGGSAAGAGAGARARAGPQAKGAPRGAGAGTAGGAGAGAVKCEALILDGPPIEVGFEPWQLASNPSLQMMENGTLLIAATVVPNESPGPVAPTLRFATMNPLGPWPAAPVPAMEFSVAGTGTSYRTLGYGDTTEIGYLYQEKGVEKQVGPVLRGAYGSLSSISPKKTIFDEASAVLAWAPHAAKVGLDGETFLALADAQPGGAATHRLLVGLDALQGGAPPASLDAGSGCATEELVADALWRGDRFLLAHSSGRKPFSCDDGSPDGPATRLQLFWQGEKKGDTEQLFDADGEGSVRFVRLLPQGAFSWLVVGRSMDSFSTPLQMLTITSGGSVGASLIDLTEGAIAPARPAVASMGDDRVAVVYAEEGGQVPHLRLRAAGLGGATPTVEVGPFFTTGTAVASPAPDTVIVGWTEGGFEARMKLARYRCVQPG